MWILNVGFRKMSDKLIKLTKIKLKIYIYVCVLHVLHERCWPMKPNDQKTTLMFLNWTVKCTLILDHCFFPPRILIHNIIDPKWLTSALTEFWFETALFGISVLSFTSAIDVVGSVDINCPGTDVGRLASAALTAKTKESRISSITN